MNRSSQIKITMKCHFALIRLENFLKKTITTDGKGLGRMMFSFYVGGTINRYNDFRRQSGAYISFLNLQTQ